MDTTAPIPKQPQSQKPQMHAVSFGTILKIVGVVVAVWFLWFIRDVIGMLFVALVLASALDPWVDRLQRWRIPRSISIIAMYLLMFFVVGFIIVDLIPLVVNQLTEIVTLLSSYAPQIDSLYQYLTQNPDVTVVKELQKNISSFNQSIATLTTGVFETVAGFISQLASLIFVLVIAFYMTVDEDALKKFIRSTAPIQYQPYLVQKANRIQNRMGAWLTGQLVLMLVVGVLTFIGLFILGVPYAFLLALLAGLAEFVPFVGPIVASIPAVFFAFTHSPWKALAVGVFYLVVQQLENQVLVPKIMQKAVGLNPIVVLAALLIGAKVAGIVGILLSIPATVILWIFVQDVIAQKKKIDNSLE